MKGRLAVTFRDAQGAVEAGLDQGGLTKELLEEVLTLRWRFIKQHPFVPACHATKPPQLVWPNEIQLKSCFYTWLITHK